MTPKMTTRWMMILGVVLLAAQVAAQETPILKTEREKANYAIGVDGRETSSSWGSRSTWISY